jgi:hypothetical protein
MELISFSEKAPKNKQTNGLHHVSILFLFANETE